MIWYEMHASIYFNLIISTMVLSAVEMHNQVRMRIFITKF